MGNGMDIEFGHQARAMIVDCFRADRQLLGNFCIGSTLSNHMQNLALANRQFGRIRGSLKRGYHGFGIVGAAIQQQRNTVANFFWWTSLQKQSVNTGGNPVRQLPHGGKSSNHGNPGVWRPASDLAVNLHTTRQRHTAIECQERWLLSFHKRYRLHAVLGLGCYFYAVNLRQYIAKRVADQRMIICYDNSQCWLLKC